MSSSVDKLEEIAQRYHANDAVPDIHIENLCQEYMIEWLLQHVSPAGRVLELGYGDGLVTAALCQSGRRVTVIEGARTLVDRARAENSGIDCIHTLFEDYRPVEPFATILASHVLEHVDDPQAILGLLRSWLSDDGRLICIVPNRNSLHRQLAVLMGLQPQLDTLSERDHLVGHQRVYSLSGLIGEIEAAGMRVVDSAGFFLKVLPNSMMLDFSRELLWCLNSISPRLPKELLANIAVIAAKR